MSLTFFGLLLLLLTILTPNSVLAEKKTNSNLFFEWFFSPSPSPQHKPEPEDKPKLEVEEIQPPSSEKVDWYDPKNKEYHSAILIAGSNEYHNYRHQADVCHAYFILRQHGLKDNKIITFVYDDIAYHENNPYPGSIFNKPGGFDVYPGCAKDYIGKDVNKENLLAVLKGDKIAVKGKGSGRVLKRDPKQRVFMFYSDHGSVGTISLPKAAPFSARELKNAFDAMIEKDMFHQLVFYLESCDAGSMFDGFGYEYQNKIFPVSAAGPVENSYAAYCPYKESAFEEAISPNATYIGSCMGDLFSISWMEYTDTNNAAEKTIRQQMESVTKRTSDHFNYRYGSHVYIYSAPENPFNDQVIGNFLAYYNVPFKGKTNGDGEHVSEAKMNTADNGHSLPQRDADLLYYYHRAERMNDDRSRAELEAVLESRSFADRAIQGIVQELFNTGALHSNYVGNDLVNESLPRGEGLQLVDDWDCFEDSIKVWGSMCGELTDYSRQYTRTFANLCNLGVTVQQFQMATMRVCAANGDVEHVV